MFDIVFKYGKITDGTGRSAYQADFPLPILLTADSLILGRQAAGRLLSWQSVPNLLR